MPDTKIYSLEATKNRMVKVVGISEAKSSSDQAVTLVTYALGSCVAVSIWDSKANVGGLWHFLLPESPENIDNPLKYADSGLDMFLEQFQAKGGDLRLAEVKLIGGAKVLANSSNDIGTQNVNSITNELHRRNIKIKACDIGKANSRTAMLRVDDGSVTIRSRKNISQI
ncbi:MAG: chemotaxis protein CheD [Phycisphaerae bacterium]|nr:chemotaxis protein CheD [Phycisphaerae bacterium]